MHSKIIGMLNVYNSYFDITYLETSMENIFVRRKEDISGAALEKMIRVPDMPLTVEGHELGWVRR